MTVNRTLEKALFEQIVNEEKHEVQFTNCQIHSGDTLILEEWDQETNACTGRRITTLVTAVQPVDEVPAGSVAEATEHGSLIAQIKTAEFSSHSA